MSPPVKDPRVITCKGNHIPPSIAASFLQIVFFFLYTLFYCEAAVAWGPGEALIMEEVEVDPPRPNEIRIKVICTSLCRSDITLWESKVMDIIFNI